MTRTTNTRLDAWLRSLANLVESGEISAEDVTQALFAEDTYKIGCVLSEHGLNGGSDAACDLFNGIARFVSLADRGSS